MGVWNGAVELSDTLVNSLQSVRTTLEAQNKPLSILYAPKVSDVTALPSDLAKIGRNGVSVIIGQDGAEWPTNSTATRPTPQKRACQHSATHSAR